MPRPDEETASCVTAAQAMERSPAFALTGPQSVSGMGAGERIMCGRFQLVVSWSTLVELYRIQGTGPSEDPLLVPRFNVCPTNRVAAVTELDGQRQLEVVRWGFPATWLKRQGKDPWSRPLINAKSEEAAHKATWRRPLAGQRCLVPTTGFIEWRKQGRKRWPIRFAGPGPDGHLTLAGIWQDFPRDGQTVRCMSLLTTSASEDVADTHDRMPVILAPNQFESWLDPATPADAVHGIMRPATPGTLTRKPLNTAVNKVATQGPEVMVPDWSLDTF
jgi:putative SOS response-associated peptidase YedK